MIKCISFDFDRTLAYVTPFTHKFVPELLKSKGIEVSEDVFIQICKELEQNTPEEIKDMFKFYGSLSKEKRREFIGIYNKYRLDRLDLSSYNGDSDKLKKWVIDQILTKQKKILYDDVVEFIKKLAKMNLKLYVLSGNNSDGIIELLEEAGIVNFFEEIITVDRFTPSKIENFKYLLEHSQLKPEEILHIGDDFHTDGYGPYQHNINTLIIRRPEQIFYNNDNEYNFSIITKLEEVLDFL